LLLTCLSVLSCSTQKATFSPFLAVYKIEGAGNIYPSYIILKQQPEIFEIYAPGVYSSIIGEWKTIKDTLFIIPRYQYAARNNKMHMNEITSEDSSIITIPQKYILTKNNLIDITDYNIILPRIFQNQKKDIYKRIK
jgi:hypothetical protein